jgi:4'-phosphopantetheinyl transferase
MTPGDVHAWFADTSALAGDAARLARALDGLPADERARADRYRHDRDRLMFVMGRVMARRLVGETLGIAPTAWPWREGPRGRPEIALLTTPVHFNLAHSAGLVCCVLASGREVGIDVEDLDRAATDPAVVARFCSPDEATAIGVGQPGWRERFLEVWTLKEAYLKARGMGISVQLADISFSTGCEGPGVRGSEGPGVRVSFVGSLVGTDARWAFRLLRPTPRHLLAIAASTADDVDPTFALDPFPADWLP